MLSLLGIKSLFHKCESLSHSPQTVSYLKDGLRISQIYSPSFVPVRHLYPSKNKNKHRRHQPQKFHKPKSIIAQPKEHHPLSYENRRNKFQEIRANVDIMQEWAPEEKIGLYHSKARAYLEGMTTKRTPKPAEDCPAPRYGITKDIFIQKIGKGCAEYASKIETWEELMTMRTIQMKKREIPVKQRKWIRRWADKYKHGIEPYAIKFKSKGKKNKAIRKAMQEKHDANMENGKKKREAFLKKGIETGNTMNVDGKTVSLYRIPFLPSLFAPPQM